jgi:tRNA G10  N-methylase Trm11
MSDLEQIYQKTFENLTRLLKPAGRMVLALPVFQNGLSVQNEIFASAGLRPVTQRYLYERENQHVRRQIVVLKK